MVRSASAANSSSAPRSASSNVGPAANAMMDESAIALGKSQARVFVMYLSGAHDMSDVGDTCCTARCAAPLPAAIVALGSPVGRPAFLSRSVKAGHAFFFTGSLLFHRQVVGAHESTRGRRRWPATTKKPRVLLCFCGRERAFTVTEWDDGHTGTAHARV